MFQRCFLNQFNTQWRKNQENLYPDRIQNRVQVLDPVRLKVVHHTELSLKRSSKRSSSTEEEPPPQPLLWDPKPAGGSAKDQNLLLSLRNSPSAPSALGIELLLY